MSEHVKSPADDRAMTTTINPNGQGEAAVFSERDRNRLDKAKTAISRILARQTQDVLEIGRLLKQAKANIDHGKFLEWIDENLPFGRRMGQVYMRIHDELSEHGDVLGQFQLKTLRALAGRAVSGEDRQTIVAEVMSGQIVSDNALLNRLMQLVQLQPARAAQMARRAETLAEQEASRTAARREAARLTCDLAGPRINEFIELIRAAGLSEFAETLEELVTSPEVTIDSQEAEPHDPVGDGTAEEPNSDFGEAEAAPRQEEAPVSSLFSRGWSPRRP